MKLFKLPVAKLAKIIKFFAKNLADSKKGINFALAKGKQLGADAMKSKRQRS